MTIGFICFDDRLMTMAQRLIKTGYKLRVCSCAEDEKLEIKGMEVVKTPAETVEPEGIVITLVPDDGKLKEVTFGPGGIGEALKEKAIHLSLSSVLPETSREIADCHRKAGAFYVSAPAINIFMVKYQSSPFFFISGPQEAKERIMPLLQNLDGEILDTGTDEGAASAMKLTAGFLIASLTESLAEGFMFAEHQGLNPHNVFKLLGEKLFACPLYNTYGERLVEHFYPKEQYEMNTAYNDMKLLAGMSHKSSLNLPVLNVIQSRLLSSLTKGRGAMDISAAGMGVLEDTPCIEVSLELKGRILNGFGMLLDGKAPPVNTVSYPIYNKPVKTKNTRTLLHTGIKVLDGLFPICRGQRVSVMLRGDAGYLRTIAMIARENSCDVNVMVFVGSLCGPAPRKFILEDLKDEGLARSVIIIAMRNSHYLERLRSFYTGIAVAEYFRDQGKDVLFIMDNINRFLWAKREAGIEAGEVPAKSGYGPSELNSLQEITGRRGNFSRGSITGFYVYLTEDVYDMTDPVNRYMYDSFDVRLKLHRKLWSWGEISPAVDINESKESAPSHLTGDKHWFASIAFKEAWRYYNDLQDSIDIGTYRTGENAKADWAVENFENLKNFINQTPGDKFSFKESADKLIELMSEPYSGGESPWLKHISRREVK